MRAREETGTYYDGLQIALLPYMQSSAATMDLVENNQDTLLLTGARAFAQPEEGDQNLITQVVLSSGYQAYLRDFSDGAETIEQQDSDPLGPFALALLSQRITEAGNVSKAFVLGCSTVLTSSQVYVMTDAQQFILTMCTYLSGAQPVAAGHHGQDRPAARPVHGFPFPGHRPGGGRTPDGAGGGPGGAAAPPPPLKEERHGAGIQEKTSPPVCAAGYCSPRLAAVLALAVGGTLLMRREQPGRK